MKEVNMEKTLKNQDILHMSNVESNQFTKECIYTALLSLLANETIDKITVTAIIKRAGVSRAGFYRNFSSKEAVLDEICDVFLSVLSEFIFDNKYQENARAWYYDLFKIVEENKETIRLLVNANVPSQYIFKLKTLTEGLYKNQDLQERYTSIAIGKALEGILADWFENGMPLSPDEMADFCMKLFHEKSPTSL